MATLWKSDTCGCSFFFTPGLKPEEQVLLNVASKCSAHDNLSDQNCHSQALGENQLRMKLIAELVKHDSSLIILDRNGNSTINLKKLDHLFDEKRNLIIFVNGKTLKAKIGDDVKRVVSDFLGV